MSAQSYARWFSNIRLSDIPEVGGKTASLGELYAMLAAEGVRVPEGFALTARAYRDALTTAGIEDELHRLGRVGVDNERSLEERDVDRLEELRTWASSRVGRSGLQSSSLR